MEIEDTIKRKRKKKVIFALIQIPSRILNSTRRIEIAVLLGELRCTIANRDRQFLAVAGCIYIVVQLKHARRNHNDAMNM